MFGIQKRFLLSLTCLLLAASPAAALESGSGLGYSVTFLGRNYDAAADQTTFRYQVKSDAKTGVKALSHFVVGIPICDSKIEVVSASPSEAVSIGTDPTTGVYGVKWDLSLEPGQSRIYSVTVAGNHKSGDVLVAVKAGKPVASIELQGVSCESGDEPKCEDGQPGCGDDTPGDDPECEDGQPGCGDDTPGDDPKCVIGDPGCRNDDRNPGDPGDRGSVDPNKDPNDRGGVDPNKDPNDRGGVDPNKDPKDRGGVENGGVDTGNRDSDPVDTPNRNVDGEIFNGGDPSGLTNDPSLNGGDDEGSSRKSAGCSISSGDSAGSALAPLALLLLLFGVVLRRRAVRG